MNFSASLSPFPQDIEVRKPHIVLVNSAELRYTLIVQIKARSVQSDWLCVDFHTVIIAPYPHRVNRIVWDSAQVFDFRGDAQKMFDVFMQLCQRNGTTPGGVARELGMSRSTLQDWKMGRSTPKADKLKQIADYFGVTMEYLMTGEETPHEPYYFNEETRELADYAFKNPDYRLLMSASRDLSAEDLKTILQIVERLKDAR